MAYVELDYLIEWMSGGFIKADVGDDIGVSF